MSLQTVKHPCDPLTADEVLAVTTAAKAHPVLASLFAPADPRNTAVFVECLLKEPLKSDVKQFGPMMPLLKRKARALVYNNVNNRTYEVIASLPEPVSNGGAGIGTPITAPLTVTLLSQVMYPNNNYDNSPVDDPFGGAQPFGYFTRAELTTAVLGNSTLMAKLLARNVTELMITSGKVYPYAFYTFESFRNFAGAAGASCPDLIPLNAVNHRFMPTVFFDETIVPGKIQATANWGMVEGIFIIVDCNDKANPIYRIVDEGPLPSGLTFTLTGSITSGTLTVTATNGNIYPGVLISGAGVLPSTQITALGTGTGGVGTYLVSPTQTVASTTITVKVPIVPAVDDPYPAVSHVARPMKSLQTTMPDGVSFEVPEDDVHSILWGNWDMRWSYQRGGMSLYLIHYTENDNRRSVIYKTAPSDTCVVYQAPTPIVSRTYVSADSHNWPVLQRLQSLVKGRDVPGYATLLPIVTVDAFGAAVVKEDALAIYEQDNDIMWRVNQGVIGLDYWPNGSGPILTGCRDRQLCVRTLFSGFYYLFTYTYMFSLDGRIAAYCDLNGQTTDQWVESDATGTETPYGQRCSLQLLALNHTHSCCWRTNFEIDGDSNSVSEENSSVILSTTENKCGQVIRVNDSILDKETGRVHNMASNRQWSVINEGSLNRLGFPRGFHLFGMAPNGNCFSLSRDNSPAHTHLGYLKNHLMVTRYRYGEEYACGEFPVLSDLVSAPPGMTSYLANKESIRDKDIVVWYNSMFFHTPHTEDKPFISAHRIGVQMTPSNFFGMNPACSLEESIDIQGPNKVLGGKPLNFTYVEQ